MYRSIIYTILVGLVCGFVIAMGSGYVWGEATVHRLPVGSLTAGVMAGLSMSEVKQRAPLRVLLFIGGLSGLLGWLLYLIVI